MGALTMPLDTFISVAFFPRNVEIVFIADRLKPPNLVAVKTLISENAILDTVSNNGRMI